jgi:hypothetical protein
MENEMGRVTYMGEETCIQDRDRKKGRNEGDSEHLHRWEHNIKMGLTEFEWKSLVQNFNQQQPVLETILNPHVPTAAAPVVVRVARGSIMYSSNT